MDDAASAATSRRHELEPADLHVVLAATHPLDWGRPIPTRRDIAAESGSRAAEAGMRRVGEVVLAERHLTAAVLAAIPDGATPYRLEHRVVSPRSMARALARRSGPSVGTVLRYGIRTDDHDDLVPLARATTAALMGRGWEIGAAGHSYVPGSRWKVVRAAMVDPGDVTVELRFDSLESARVKERAKALDEISRDPRRGMRERVGARAEAARLTERLRPPNGLAGLRTLCGRAVEIVAATHPDDVEFDSRSRFGREGFGREGFGRDGD